MAGTGTAHLRTDDSDLVLVRSAVDLGHNLGLHVVAEGVEDAQTLDALAAMGCDLVQGNCIGTDRTGRVARPNGADGVFVVNSGGNVIGAPLAGRVLIVDDVISAGTSVRESVEIIRQAGGRTSGVAIALDRMEKGTGELSAVQEVRQTYGIPVSSIADLDDLIGFLEAEGSMKPELDAVQRYRDRYGVSSNA